MKKELKNIVKEFEAIIKKRDEIGEKMHDLFMAEIKPLLDKKEFREARMFAFKMPESLEKFDAISVISHHERLNDIEKLMEIRKNWKKKDFTEAYGDEWNSIPRSLKDCFEKMKEHIYHTYDSNYIWECIRDEK